jgi:pyrroloquinoline quinone biosynthesis protein B
MTGPRAIVLGSAAGGGFPQWNCRCPVCTLAWEGDPRVRARTQSSIAVTADGQSWLVVNASPDFRQQVAATPALQPRAAPRHSPIAAVLVTNGDIDHVAGLLSMREMQPFRLYGTAATLGEIAANAVFGAVNPAVVARETVALDATFEPLPGLAVQLFAVPGKVPLYREDASLVIGAETETTIGLRITAGGRSLVYVPGCASLNARVLKLIDGAEALLFDATVFEDDEMIRSGTGTKTGRRMGHVPIAGAEGSLAGLSQVKAGRRIFIHINNTNPILVDGSPARQTVEAAGWTVAHDGLEIWP